MTSLGRAACESQMQYSKDSRLSRVISELDGCRQAGEHQYQARCPSHEDRQASLSVGMADDGKILAFCHAGCPTEAVVSALGLTMADLMPPKEASSKSRIVKTYDYRNEQGELIYQACRKEPKGFVQRAPDGDGWKWSTKGITPLPYRLPELLSSDTSVTVFIPEGEKDVDRLTAAGLVATCNHGGAGKWTAEHAKHLQGRHVAILPDHDEPGGQHAVQVARTLQGIAASVKIVELPGLPEKGDASDWLDAGNSIAELVELVKQTPEYAPGGVSNGEAESKPERFSNAKTIEIEVEPEQILGDASEEEVEGEPQKKKVRVPLTMSEIIGDMNRRTDGWPRRVGQSLFYDAGGQIAWLGNPSALFGYLAAELGRVDWFSGIGYVTRAELYENLRNTATRYEAIEELPHFPPLRRHYYACPSPKPGNGRALDGLLARYRPSTTIDGDLLKAAIVTLFWGGPGGARPAFVITSDAGRGAGKTKTAESIAYVAGGHLDISAQEDIGKIKERFLTPSALTKRSALLDNVKSFKFSSAELEGLITCRTISGRALYVGDSSRPNVVTWFMTLNGVSLSNDLAQRSVIIKVDKGRNDAGWYEGTLDYIDQHRQAIIADCAAFLAMPTTELSSYSRWASWDRDILSRLPEPEEARQTIIDRQGESDADADEAEIIADYFAERLESLEYDSERDVVRIPVSIVAEWYGKATGERLSTTKVSRHVGQMVSEGKLPQLTKDPARNYGRCYIWAGQYADIAAIPANDLMARLAQHSQAFEWGVRQDV